jgi:hypothetical protein
MPNAESYQVKHVMKGPGKLWIGVALPADGARLKLKATGEPDDTESPNAIFMGMTKEGCTFTQTFTEEEEECDEFNGAFRSDVDKEEATIEGEFFEVLNFDRLAQLMPNATLVKVAAATGQKGAEQLKFGGKLRLANIPVALITEKVDNPGEFVVCQLYAAHNGAGLKLGLNKKKSAAIPFKFAAYVVPARAKGDRLATIWQETPALA